MFQSQKHEHYFKFFWFRCEKRGLCLLGNICKCVDNVTKSKVAIVQGGFVCMYVCVCLFVSLCVFVCGCAVVCVCVSVRACTLAYDAHTKRYNVTEQCLEFVSHSV